MKKAKQRRSFSDRVYAVVAKIPRGKTMTYKQVAAKAGKPLAARAVGMLMSHNYDPKIPCHRVVRSDGKVGDYNRGGPSRKIELLLEEAYRR
jgi:methylated-DNA-[protein]-cysteine S-methyltransferase